MGGSEVTIAVATYRRPRMLSRLLDSIERSTVIARPQVVVVDNDPEESARRTVEEWTYEAAKYVSEPRPGISNARNAGIYAAQGSEFVVFVDDDEHVSAGWLEALLDTVHKYDADAVAGPVISLLNENCPPWIQHSGLFNRSRRPTGTQISEAGAGNLLIRRSVLTELSLTEWFRPDLGLSGGEDADLTRRMTAMGYRIIWCDEAEVWEEVPPQRTTFDWLAKRFVRLASVDYRLAPPSRSKRTKAFVGGSGRIVVGLVGLGVALVCRRRVDSVAFKRIFRGVGFIRAAMGRHSYEYAR